MAQTKTLSSLEELLLGIDQPEICQTFVHHHQGGVCLQCQEGVLDYNGLLSWNVPPVDLPKVRRHRLYLIK